MKTRELAMGGKQGIFKLRNEGKLIRAIAQALDIARYNNLECCGKRKEPCCVPAASH